MIILHDFVLELKKKLHMQKVFEKKTVILKYKAFEIDMTYE